MSLPAHRALCEQAGRWLRGRGCTVVLIEPISLRVCERPDAIGWCLGCDSILIEAKTSRQDFLRDARKVCRQEGGYLGQWRYFLTPKGLVRPEELPERWGLLEVRGSRIAVVRSADEWPATDLRRQNEMALAIGQLERLQSGLMSHLLPPRAVSPMPRG